MALLWFFGHSNLLEAQGQYNIFPHNYRMDVLFQSESYLRGLHEAPVTEAAWVRVIRDPYKRAVSSFQQSLTNAYNDRAVSDFVGRHVDEHSGYSFREYIEHLLHRDITTCNPHEHPQRHSIEDVVQPLRIVNIDTGDLWRELRLFEIEAGVPPMNSRNRRLLKSEAARVSEFHHTRREPMLGAADVRSNRGTLLTVWPSYADYLTEELRAHIRAIYHVDFRAYESVLS
jgi:hypothetical protein